MVIRKCGLIKSQMEQGNLTHLGNENEADHDVKLRMSYTNKMESEWWGTREGKN